MLKINKAIENYNKYRSPESIAMLISKKDEKFIVRFTGPYCYTCGVHDYFEDLVVELEDLNIKAKIKKVNKIDNFTHEVEFELI